jgi:hypothetical protein
MTCISKIRIPICTLITLVAGCATPYDALRDYKGQDYGTVVLSLSQPSGNTSLPPSLAVRRIGTAELVRIDFSSWGGGNLVIDFESPSGGGRVVTKRLPPGGYEIYSFQLGNETGPVRFSSEIKTPVRFSIRTAETSYVGSYAISLKIQQGAPVKQSGVVVTVPTSGLALDIEISDEQQRDLKIAAGRNPEMAGKPITSNVQFSTSKN